MNQKLEEIRKNVERSRQELGPYPNPDVKVRLFIALNDIEWLIRELETLRAER